MSLRIDSFFFLLSTAISPSYIYDTMLENPILYFLFKCLDEYRTCGKLSRRLDIAVVTCKFFSKKIQQWNSEQCIYFSLSSVAVQKSDSILHFLYVLHCISYLPCLSWTLEKRFFGEGKRKPVPSDIFYELWIHKLPLH